MICQEVASVELNPDHLHSLVHFSTPLSSSCCFNCPTIPATICFPHVQWLGLKLCLILRFCLLINLRCRKFCISIPWLAPWRDAFHSVLPWVYSVGHHERHMESVILFIGEMLLRTLFSTLLSVPNIKSHVSHFSRA